MPAASASGAMVAEMLAGEDFGRRHEGGLPAGFDHRRRRDQRHHGLAGADIALQQPQHALRAGEVGDDVVDRLLLRMRERIRQRLQDARAQAAFAGRAAAGLPAHMRAHQRQRELAGEQFVIGEPRPGRDFPARCRAARPAGADGAARRRKPENARATTQASSCHSGSSGRRASAPSMARRTLPSAKPFGERIDRLDQRQIGKALLVDHAVGMHHLQHAVVEFGGAGDVARLAHRQQLFQIVLARVEISQRQRRRCRRWR